MAPPKTPLRIRLEELLADGNWHDRAEVLDELAPLVPPGKAIRAAETDRAGNRRRNGNPGPANPALSRARDPQTVGARACATDIIKSAYQCGRIERRTINGVTQYRLSVA